MKNTFKRLLSVLMLICMLAAMVVPATFAEDTRQQETIVYDFQVYENADFKSGFTYTALPNNFNGHRTYNGTISIAQWFYNSYPQTINWGMETSGGVNGTLKDFDFRGKTDQGLALYPGTSGFIAVRVYVPAAGTYDISLQAGSTDSSADIYMFPATTAYGAKTLTSKDTIIAAIADSGNLLDDNVEISAQSNISLGGKTFDTAGDYIVVFTSEESYADGIRIRSLTLTPALEEPEETAAPDITGEDVDYKFDVVNQYPDQCASLHKQYFVNKGSTAALDLLTSLYPDTLNWKYETSHTGEIPTVRIQSGEGLRLYGEQDGWVAFRLTGLTTGMYDISLTSTGGGCTADVYLIPADQTISESLTSENLLKSGLTAGAQLGKNVSITGGDYFIVFSFAAVGGNGYFRLNALNFTPVADSSEETTAPAETTTAPTEPEGTEPSEPSGPSADSSFYFDVVNQYASLCDKLDKKNFKNSTDYGMQAGAYLATLYPDTLNWKYEDCSNDDLTQIRVMKGEGLRIHGTEGFWVAFRLNAISAGTYDVTLTGAGGGNNVAVYLIKATAGMDIAAAMTEENLIEPNMLSTEKIATDHKLDAGDYLLVIQNISIDGNGYFRIKQLDITLSDGQPETDSDVPEEPSEPEPEIPLEQDNDGDFTFDVVNNYPAFGATLSGRNYQNTATDSKGNIVMTPDGKQHRIESYLASMYEQGYMDWVLEAVSFQNGGGSSNIQVRPGQGLRLVGTVGDWTALRVRVPAAGEYNLKISGSGTNVASLYLVKATEGMDIAAAMTEENLLIADVSSASNVAVKEKVSLEAADYILIVLQTGTNNTGKDYWAINRLELETWKEKEPQPITDKTVYDFDMVAMDSRFLKKGMNNRLYTDGIRASAQIQELYNAGQLHWIYEGSGAGNTDMTFRDNALRIRSAKNYNSVADSFVAFRIKNPGTDTYDVRLVTDGASMLCMNVYLIPLQNTLVLDAEAMKAEMTSDNLLVANAMLNKAGTYYLGEYAFGYEDQYLLVFEFTKGTAFFLSQVEMTKDGLVADSAIQYGTSYKGVVYDLDLADAMNGIYPESRLNMPDVIDDMNARWDNGSLNWKWLNGIDGLSGSTPATDYDPTTSLRFYRGSGMRVYAGPDNWMALKIKSPGSGDFTITLNHATTANSGTIAMYILPADTDIDKIWEATDPENRVGKVYLGNEDGSDAIVDGSTSFVGYWNFEAGKEYILVIESYETSKFNSRYCYMNMSQIIMERGIVDYGTNTEEKKVEPITVVDYAIPVFDIGQFAASSEVNGHDYMYLPMEGCFMLVYDLDTYSLVDSVTTSISYSRNMAVGPEGNVYVVGTGGMLGIYNPYTMEYWESSRVSTTPGIGECSNVLNAITVDDNGIVWMGTHYGAQIVSYNVETKEFTYWGQPCGYQLSIKGMLWHDGYLYAGIDGEVNHYIIKMDTTTGEVVAKTEITEFMGTDETILSLNMLADKYLVVGGSRMTQFVALDPNTLELINVPTMPACVGLCVSEEIDGKYYMVLNGYGLYQYDVATDSFSKTPGFGTAGTGFRTGGQSSFGNTLITIKGDPCLVTMASGQPKYFNLNTHEYISMEGLMKPEHAVGGQAARGFIQWEEGSNRFSFGAFNTTLCAVYNTELGKIEYYYNTGGQTDSQVWYDGKLYAGNYSSTTLNEIYPDPENVNNEIIQRWRLDHEETGQKRVHCLAAGDGYVFAGTTPDTNLRGGGIVVYDTRTGRWKFTRNPVENGSIMSLTYYDGLLYGTTTGSGGSGEGYAGSAVAFVFDYNTHETLAVLDPRDYIKDLGDPVYHVRCVVPDPNIDENGRFWSMVSETLFCFTYDTETKTFHVQEVISFDKTTYNTNSTNNWFPKTILFDMERNYIYASFHGKGGFQRIELENWNAEIGSIQVKANDRIMSDIPDSNFMLLGEDGNLYYARGTGIGMLPLNVTDEDWAISQQVDDLILAIGDEITVETEAAIRTARSAYENLSWYYKALVQNLELLREAESDILERKIDTYKDLEITIAYFQPLGELMNEYQGLNSRQQRYVKNYAALKDAYSIASDLNDQKVAADMQARIDSLEDKFPLTLENEEEVLTLRADVNALTGKQFILLDISALEDAEAQIAELRAEFVAYVETLIQAIPAEITLDAEAAITAAREAADKLYISERKVISYSKLTAAEGKLRTLKNAKAKADPVVAMIDSIGTVWWNDAQVIAEARAAYEALNGTERTFVVNYDILVAAEERLAQVQTWGVPVIAGGGAVILLAALLVIFRKKIFKGKKQKAEKAES